MKKSNILFILSLLFTVFVFSSCEDSTLPIKEIYKDTDGTRYTPKVFFKGITSEGYLQQGVVLQLKPEQISISTSSLKLQVAITKIIEEDTKVTVEVEKDENVLKEYNNNIGKTYQLLPESAIEIHNKTLLIPAGSSVSSDSLEIIITHPEELTNIRGYVLPLTIRESSIALPNDKSKTTYYIYCDLYALNLGKEEDVDESKWFDRSTWKASVISSNAQLKANLEATLNNLFDGDVKTNCTSKMVSGRSQDAGIMIDLGKEKELSGVVLTKSVVTEDYWGEMHPKEVEILVGSTPDDIYSAGKLKVNSPYYTKQYHNLQFGIPVKARFVLVKVLSTFVWSNDYGVEIPELNIY